MGIYTQLYVEKKNYNDKHKLKNKPHSYCHHLIHLGIASWCQWSNPLALSFLSCIWIKWIYGLYLTVYFSLPYWGVFSINISFFLFHRYWENEKVRLAYRPVHMNTLDDEIEPFPPKARVYWDISLLLWIVIFEFLSLGGSNKIFSIWIIFLSRRKSIESVINVGWNDIPVSWSRGNNITSILIGSVSWLNKV